MSIVTTNGEKLLVRNFTLNDTTDVGVTLTAPAGTSYKAASFIVKCRTAVDIYVRSESGALEYFTIASGTVLTIPVSSSKKPTMWLRAASGTPVAEVLVLSE